MPTPFRSMVISPLEKLYIPLQSALPESIRFYESMILAGSLRIIEIRSKTVCTTTTPSQSLFSLASLHCSYPLLETPAKTTQECSTLQFVSPHVEPIIRDLGKL